MLKLYKKIEGTSGNLTSSGSFTVTGGQRLAIETSPEGEEILTVEVPAGKTWDVAITLTILES